MTRTTPVQRLVAHAILAIAALTIVVPLVWIVLSSFKNEIDIAMGTLLFEPVLRNFEELVVERNPSFLSNYGNSLIVASTATLLCLSAGTLAAYSIDRLQWPAWVRHSFLAWSML